METREHAVSITCGDGVIGCKAGRAQYYYHCMDGHHLFGSSMCYISVRPNRHSYDILKKNREFVINLTTADLAFATDWCGVRSGRDHNKFEAMKLTPGQASMVSAPIIEEAPVNIECKVTEIIPLGTHHLFLAEVVNVKAEDRYLNSKTGAFSLEDANLMAYAHGKYYELGKKIGKFGYSVEKKKRKKKKGK